MVEVKNPEIRQKSKLIAIVGPTACGKTSRAVDLARMLNGEIISADSRQIYRGMDLGTGKDLEDYGEIPYHLIDICDAGQKYNLHRYISDFHKALDCIYTRGKQPVVCGGTGMYVETALSGVTLPDVPQNLALRNKLSDKSLDELTIILKSFKTLHNTTDIDTAKRAIRAIEIEEYYKTHPDEAIQADRKVAKKLNSLIIGIDIPREQRREMISKRLKVRLANGMIEEVEKLLASGVTPEDLIYYGLEYKFLTLHVIGKLSRQQMEHDLEIAIHQFAKRQMTWFRGMERRGFNINWLPWNLTKEQFNNKVISLLNDNDFTQ